MMTLNERRFYRLAVFLSIGFHLAILFITIPLPDLIAQNNDLETMSPDMLDLPPGSTNSQPSLFESAQNLPGPAAPPKPAAPTVIPPQQEKEQPSQPKVKAEVEVKVDKTKQEPVKPKEVPKKELTKPKEEPKEKTVPKIASPEKGIEKPTTATKTDPGSKSINGNGNGTGPGEGGKYPASKNFGSGDKMVSGGMNVVPLYHPKNALNEGKEGSSKLRALIMPDGSLESVVLMESSGDSRLDNAASKYIARNWKFKANKEKYFIDLLVIFKLDADPVIQFLHSETRN